MQNWVEKGAHVQMLRWKQGYPAIVTGLSMLEGKIVTLSWQHFLACPFSLLKYPEYEIGGQMSGVQN